MKGAIEVDGTAIPLAVRRSAAARRLILRADPASGAIRLTIPPRTPLALAERFLADHRGWIAAQVARWPAVVAFEPGAVIAVEGEPVTIDWSPSHPRGVSLANGTLRVGGSREALAARVERFLRARALALLDAETRALAPRTGRAIAAVSVRDPKARWGSCSSTGRIAYSWRLVMAPAFVRHAVVAHEVAHLVHLDHSRAFWRLATELLGGSHKPARGWLAAHGPGLHRVGVRAPR